MPNLRLSISLISETLRLRKKLDFSNRQIADVIKASPSTVAGYVRRAEVAGIHYPAAVALGRDALER